MQAERYKPAKKVAKVPSFKGKKENQVKALKSAGKGITLMSGYDENGKNIDYDKLRKRTKGPINITSLD